ncbi:MAG TPA: hypothetical protein VNQ73_00140 [Ilumatobacter sp.]|nr:hypothetical protein [Ilumatobacter sp.]
MSTLTTSTAPDVRAALGVLLDADPACFERADLADAGGCVRVVRGFLDAFDLQLARRSRQLAERERPSGQTPSPQAGQHEASQSLLDMGATSSGAEARGIATREAACGDVPGFEEALKAAEISSGHIDVLARQLKRLTDAERSELVARAGELLAQARGSIAEGFEYWLRRTVDEIRARHRPTAADDELAAQRKASKVTEWTDQHTGMRHTKIELDPLRGDQLSRRLRNELNRLRNDTTPGVPARSYEELKVQALMNVVGVSDTPNTPAPEPRVAPQPAAPKAGRPNLVVHLDYRWLLDELAATGAICQLADGTPIPAGVARQMAVDANIIPVVLGGASEVLDVGRARRLATEAQRVALNAIYIGCVEPGCGVGFDDCHIHHTNPWERHGDTNLDQLAPLCVRGHDRIHEQGWHLKIGPDHEWVEWTRPDGTTAYHGPAPNRRR